MMLFIFLVLFSLAAGQDSPGIPGGGYLGRGYDIFKGNPRGTMKNELDPGFRFPVIDIVQDQSQTTFTTDFLSPYGVMFSSVPSCEYSSTSIEISNEQQYSRELSREVSVSASVSGSAAGVLKGVPLGASASGSFSRSERYQSFSMTTSSTQTVTYEAKAMCTEYRLSLEPYYNHSLKTQVQEALESLPEKYDPSDEVNRTKFYRFLDAYGTHVVSDVLLGAKHIYSSVIKATDVVELTRQKIDIKNTMSFQLQFAVGSSANEAKMALSAGGDDGDDGPNVKVFDCRGNQTTTPSPPPPAPPASPSLGKLLGGSIGVSATVSTATSSTVESVNRITEKIQTVNEVNIGGRPPVDGNWKTWAESAADRPMPIGLELRGIWEFMDTVDQAKAFFDCVLDRYGLDFDAETSSEELESMHFGIYRPDAFPITKYSAAPNDNYRCLLAVELFLPLEIEGEKIELAKTTGHGIYESGMKTCPPGLVACAARVQRDLRTYCPLSSFLCFLGTIRFQFAEVLTGLQIKCCPARVELDIEPYELTVSKGRGRWSEWKGCKRGFFIEEAEISRTPSSFNRKRDVVGLWIKCSTDDAEFQKVFDGLGTGKRQGPKKGQASGKPVVNGAKAQKRGPWLTNIEMLFTPQEKVADITNRGPDKPLYLYEAVWDGSESFVSAIFATPLIGDIVPNVAETQKANFDPEAVRSGAWNPFAIFSLSEASRATFGVYNFMDDVLFSSYLEPFCFLSADNLPSKANFTAGVIHYDGSSVNEIFGLDNGFTVAKQDGSNFIVSFPSSNVPTFIASPLWIEDNALPATNGDVVVSVNRCIPSEPIGDRIDCYVRIGCRGCFVDDKLGFNFLALTEYQPQGIVHGRVRVSAGFVSDGPVNPDEPNATAYPAVTIRNQETVTYNSTAKAVSMKAPEKSIAGRDWNGNEPLFLGVEITFDKRFEAPPSVIVTPHMEGVETAATPWLGSNGTLLMPNLTDWINAYPIAIVEHVTTEKAFIKAGLYYPDGFIRTEEDDADINSDQFNGTDPFLDFNDTVPELSDPIPGGLLYGADGTEFRADFAFVPTSFDYVVVGPPLQRELR